MDTGNSKRSNMCLKITKQSCASNTMKIFTAPTAFDANLCIKSRKFRNPMTLIIQTS